jgi:hypothetical protein
MQSVTLMFAVILLVSACSVMHERSDYAVDGRVPGALGGLAGSPDDERASGAGLSLTPAVSTIVRHLLGKEGKEAPPSPVAQAPSPSSSKTLEVRERRLDLDSATPHPDGENRLWLRPTAVLRLLDREGR